VGQLESTLKVFAGTSNPALAERIAGHLGIPLGAALVDAFPDGETRVRIEENVRGTDVYVVQSTCAPVNQNLMQLLIMVDAMRRASAERVTAVIPYFGYARQEKKSSGREPITGKLVANLLQAAGTARVVTLDLHAPAVEGFFDVPVDHLRAAPLLADALRKMDLQDPVVVSPDVGGVARAYEFSGRLGNASLAIVFKDRTAPGSVRPLQIVGDVVGRQAILVDDLISTAGTMVSASDALLAQGTNATHACVTHAVLATQAVDTLVQSSIESVFVTDTVPLPERQDHDAFHVVDTSKLFAEAVRRIHNNESVSALFV
jgi:ribose-phosphate pyrophosphokinase